MRIAVSNIAWPLESDAEVAATLTDLGVDAIEIAPTKIWPSPLTATDSEIDRYRGFWNDRGISIVAAQALLFGKPDLTLFDDESTRERTLEYLAGIAKLCARLGAKALVFGSPKNRLRKSLEPGAAFEIATGFFRALAERAAEAGTAIVMEANPVEYGADFATRGGEALELVRAVDHPGFRLHLDTACMALAKDDAEALIPAAAPWLSHFHASEPNLAPVGWDGGLDHARFGALLNSIRYDGCVSIEMRQVDPFRVDSLKTAIRTVQAAYGNG